MDQLTCNRPSSPGSGHDAATPVGGGSTPCPPPCSCSVSITPNPLEIYVSQPHMKLTATVSPSGGKFVWVSGDPTKLQITGTGGTVAVKGLDEGDVNVTLSYTPPGCGSCSTTATVKIRYEVRHIFIAQGIQFNNAQYATRAGLENQGDLQEPNGYLYNHLKSATPFPMTLTSGGKSAIFKSVKQGVKFTIDVSNSRIDFQKALEHDGKPGTKELEYWHVVYDGHSRYGRGACFSPSDDPGENWENSGDPKKGPTGLFRMGYPFVGIPVAEIVHHGYSTNVVSVKIDAPKKDREYKGSMYPRTLEELKRETADFLNYALDHDAIEPLEMSEDDVIDVLNNIDDLDKRLHLVGDTAPLSTIGPLLKSDDRFWSYKTNEGPLVLLDAGWQNTLAKPMDLGATSLKCRVFAHLGCKSFVHYRAILRFQKGWKKQGATDRLAYFTTDLSLGGATTAFWILSWMTYDKFNAGLAWEPSIEYARGKANGMIKRYLYGRRQRVFQIW